MDKERYIAEGRDKKIKEIISKGKIEENKSLEDLNYRLIQEYEVPSWINVESFKEKEKIEENYGKGMRKKANINYKDEVDEDEFAEEGSDDNQSGKISKTKNEETLLSKKRRNDVDDSKSSDANFDEEDFNDYSNSVIYKNGKARNMKMRINLNSDSVLISGKKII